MAPRKSSNTNGGTPPEQEPVEDRQTASVQAAKGVGDAPASPTQDTPPPAKADGGADKLASRYAAASEEEIPPSEFIVRVVGPRKGFRRAGRRFGPEPVDIPADSLSLNEMAALEVEPKLVVSVIPRAQANADT